MSRRLTSPPRRGVTALSLLGGAACCLAATACDQRIVVGSRYAKVQLVEALAGGTVTVTSADDPNLAGTVLRIPPNALSEDTLITVAEANPLELPSSASALAVAAELGPPDALFASPATIVLPCHRSADQPVDGLTIQGLLAEGTAIHVSNADLTGTDGGTAAFSTTRLLDAVCAYNPASASPCPPGQDLCVCCGSSGACVPTGHACPALCPIVCPDGDDGVGDGGAPPDGSGGADGGSTCVTGTTSTAWATACRTTPKASCTPGTWTAAGSPNAGDVLVSESAHVAVYSRSGLPPSLAQVIIAVIEDAIWPVYFGRPMFVPEPWCSATDKRKVSAVVNPGNVLGGAVVGGNLVMTLAPTDVADARRERWGIAYAFFSAVARQRQGLQCGSGATDFCRAFFDTYANFMVHQLPEFRDHVGCTEMLVNVPHLYLGSSRNQSCDWQYLEYLKDTHCYDAVDDLLGAPSPSDDPFVNLAVTRVWSTSQLNDFFGEWAMHNVTWDYVDSSPAVPTSAVPGEVFRAGYGPITDTSQPERRLRLTSLEPLDAAFATHHRFASPVLSAPQRWGYNVVELLPEPGAAEVKVTFRGVTQAGANSDWRWGLVATNGGLTTARYSPLQRGADGALSFCVAASERLWLVVLGAPSAPTSIFFNQPYDTLWRYPYMVELHGAWPRGFAGGLREACPGGLVQHVNGGGCAPPSLAPSVFVGPYAQVLGGTLTGTTRVDGHATVVDALVSDSTVTGLSVLTGGVRVQGGARIETSFYPVGFFEPFQAVIGPSTWLYGDVELRGASFTVPAGSFSGLVDPRTSSRTIADVNTPPPSTWRP